VSEEAPTPKKKRKLLGFYVAALVVLGLVVGFYFAWTPVRAMYYEWSLRAYFTTSGNDETQTTRWRAGLMTFIKLGPIAGPKLLRLLRDTAPAKREDLIMAAGLSGKPWVLPMLAAAARNGDPDEVVEAVSGAERITGATFFPRGPRWTIKWTGPDTASLEKRTLKEGEMTEGRKKFLEWWAQEGHSEYGKYAH
jgi:hypothetical protein